MSQGFARHFGLPLRILVKYASILPVSDLGLAQISRTVCTWFYLPIICFLIVLSGLTWKKNNQTQQKCLSVPYHKAKHLEMESWNHMGCTATQLKISLIFLYPSAKTYIFCWWDSIIMSTVKHHHCESPIQVLHVCIHVTLEEIL